MMPYFCKRRFVLENHPLAVTGIAARPRSDFDIVVNPDLNEHRTWKEQLEQQVGINVLRGRVSDHHVDFLIAVHKETNSVAGYYWAITASTERLWHDSIPIRPRTSLLFNAVVLPAFRRKGLYRNLIVHAQTFLFEVHGVETVWTIVEDTNLKSLNSNLSCGATIIGNNYLVKFFGRNIWSILRVDGHRKEIHYVFKTTKGHRF